MKESLENILKKGYGTWRENLVLGLPFLFSSIISLIILGVIILGALLAIGGLFATTLSSGSFLPSLLDDFTNARYIFPLLFLAIILIIVIVLVISLIDAFFTAGAIGMAQEATKKGRTSLKSMMSYGQKKFISLFLSQAILGIIVLFSLAVLVMIFIGLPYLMGAFSGGSIPLSILLFLILGVIIVFFFSLLVSLVFLPLPYAVVISDLGAWEGIKKSYRFFLDHKLDTFLMWLVVLLITLGMSVVSTIVRLLFSFIPLLGIIIGVIINVLVGLLSVLVIAPLTTVWWTRLYLEREGMRSTPPQKTSLNPEYHI